MIRYRIRQRDLFSAIEQEKPGWRDRAATRTEELRALGHWEDSGSIWGEVKRVYMHLQGFKCGFCERRLEHSAYGNIEHDVEHFRPKGRVSGWPTSAIQRDRDARVLAADGVTDVTAAASADDDPTGYLLLAHEPENYLVACKTCNSILKRSWFPVAGRRDSAGDTVRSLSDEKPHLPYPIGLSDVHDPEDLVTFRGIVPIPAGTRGHKRRRGEVTIRFFELDTREGLLVERAEVIVALHLAMRLLADDDPAVRAAADTTVARMLADRAPHASCARSHHDLALSDPGLAHDLFVELAAWLVGR